MQCEHRDLGAGWTLLSDPAACPSPAFLPPCLPASLQCETTPPPTPPPRTRRCSSAKKGRRVGHQPWELAPKFWISSGADYGQRGRVWRKRHRPRKASPGKCCAILPRHPWPRWQPAQWSQLGHLCRTPHPKVVGTLNRIGIKTSWGFLTNKKKVPLNLGEEKLLWSVSRLCLWRTRCYRP